MPRFQTDDDFYDDPAVARAGTAAMGLYYRCGVYVARHLLDGLVPTEIAAQYGTPEWTKRLLDAGLWEMVPGGQFGMPLYFAHGNPTREQVLAGRAMKAARQRKWLEKQRSGRPDERRVSRRATDRSDSASQDGSVTHALPLSLTGKKGRARSIGAGAPRAAEQQPKKPPWCGGCDERTRFTDDDCPRYCPRCHPLAQEVTDDAHSRT
jgi:hypothetical protein